MNKIYELVFYWEDIYNGCEITETILTTSRERVEAEIEGFRNRNLKNGGEIRPLKLPITIMYHKVQLQTVVTLTIELKQLADFFLVIIKVVV